MTSLQINIDSLRDEEISERVMINEREKRLHLFTHSSIEDGRRTYSGIGKQDLSALSASHDNTQHHNQDATEEPGEVLSIKTKDGQQIEIPRLSREQRAQVAKLLSGVDEKTRAEYVAQLTEFGRAVHEHEVYNPGVAAVHSLTVTRSAQVAQDAFFVTDGEYGLQKEQENAMLMGMFGVEKNLVDFFNEIQDEQQVASEVRTDIAELDVMINEWPDDGSTELFDYTEVRFNEDKSITVIDHRDVALTKQEAINLREELQTQEDSLGAFDMTQMQYLQMFVQKYQQALTTVSNIVKLIDENLKGILQNAKAG